MRRLLLTSASTLVLLLVIGLGPAAAAPPADKLQIVEFSFEDSSPFVFDFECGFFVVHRIEARALFKFPETFEGMPSQAVVQGVHHTFIGPTGASVTFIEAGVVKSEFTADDGILTVTSAGSFTTIGVPFAGPVPVVVGRTVTQITFATEFGFPEVISIETLSASGQPLLSAEEGAAVCAALAG
jgi:hypothetical protein